MSCANQGPLLSLRAITRKLANNYIRRALLLTKRGYAAKAKQDTSFHIQKGALLPARALVMHN
jgi:hypothetical protein